MVASYLLPAASPLFPFLIPKAAKRCRILNTNAQLAITHFRVSIYSVPFLGSLINVLVLRVSDVAPKLKDLYVEVKVKDTVQRTQVIHDASSAWEETLPM